VRPTTVVVFTPVGQLPLCVEERNEVMFVKAFVAKPPVEAFDERVLRRLAGLNEMQSHAAIVSPSKHGEAPHLRAVVEYDSFRVSAAQGDVVEDARHALAGEREVDFECKIFTRAIVADPENTKTPVTA